MSDMPFASIAANERWAQGVDRTGALVRRSGRVYLMPLPPSGPHPGYRGPLSMDALGVYITWDCEALQITKEHDGRVDWEWEPALVEELVPWHRVHSVQWDDSEPPPDA